MSSRTLALLVGIMGICLGLSICLYAFYLYSDQHISLSTGIIGMAIGIASTSCACLSLYLQRKHIYQPLETIQNKIQTLLNGKQDLSMEIDIDSRSPLSGVTQDLNQFIALMHDIFANIATVSVRLSQLSEDLHHSTSPQEQSSPDSKNLMQINKYNTEVLVGGKYINSHLNNANKVGAQLNKQAQQAKGESGKTLDAVQSLTNQTASAKFVIADLKQHYNQANHAASQIKDAIESVKLNVLNTAIEASRYEHLDLDLSLLIDKVPQLANSSVENIDHLNNSLKHIEDKLTSMIGIVDQNQEQLQLLGNISRHSSDALLTINSDSEQLLSIHHKLNHAINEQEQLSTNIQQIVKSLGGDKPSSHQAELHSLTYMLSDCANKLLNNTARFNMGLYQEPRPKARKVNQAKPDKACDTAELTEHAAEANNLIPFKIKDAKS